MKPIALAAARIAAIYMLVGATWVFFSDALLEAIVDDVSTMRVLQTWKGLAFILVTGLLVFWMSWWALHRQESLIKRLENHAYTHPLTELPSRQAALDRIQGAVDPPGLDDRQVAIVTFDLDGFSAINDGFGHKTGDVLLRAVADRLRGTLTRGDFLAHPGADEFVFVFEDIKEDRDLSQRIEQARALLAKPFDLPEIRDLHVSASVGVSLAPRDSRNASDLLRYSEAAVAEVKRHAPGSVQMFDAEIVNKAHRRLALDSELRLALANNELRLHYQPVYSTEQQTTITGLEALLRWRRPDGRRVSPTELIRVAERTGLIKEVGNWVIDQACAQIAQWRAAGLSVKPVALNLSPRQFESPDLIVQQLISAMQRHEVAPAQLTLEITESFLMQQGRSARQLLQSLRDAGLRVALDDFGTGYSSLAYLHDLPLDILKIDRSFITRLESAQSSRDLVKAMISLAEIFNLSVVAEGVENEAQMAILKALGCHCFQGFLLSKPVPPARIQSLLANAA